MFIDSKNLPFLISYLEARLEKLAKEILDLETLILTCWPPKVTLKLEPDKTPFTLQQIYRLTGKQTERRRKANARIKSLKGELNKKEIEKESLQKELEGLKKMKQ